MKQQIRRLGGAPDPDASFPFSFTDLGLITRRPA